MSGLSKVIDFLFRTEQAREAFRKLTMDKIDHGTMSNVDVSVQKLLDINKTIVRMLKRRAR